MNHETLLRSILLRLDPELAHTCVMKLLNAYQYLPNWHNSQSNTETKQYLGLSFKNCVGLAAGFDKNAELLFAWEKLGFGFAEVGTVTALPQPGNPAPRIFRLPAQHMLLNRMGFNNDGAKIISKRIAQQRACHNITIPIGVNIGKSKVVALENAAEDYKTSFITLADVADYFVINVSSPNTPGLRSLQTHDKLQALLNVLCNENARLIKPKPLLLKLSPDETFVHLKSIADIAVNYGLQGLIISNTSTDTSLVPEAKKFGAGGISGAPLFKKSTKCLKALSAHAGNKLILIANGGIITAENAREKINAGAHLVQIYTGFIYNGPGLITKIHASARYVC